MTGPQPLRGRQGRIIAIDEAERLLGPAEPVRGLLQPLNRQMSAEEARRNAVPAKRGCRSCREKGK